jgi:hypothetical protein
LTLITSNPRHLGTWTTRYLNISVLTWTFRYWPGHLGTQYWKVRDLDETIFGTDHNCLVLINCQYFSSSLWSCVRIVKLAKRAYIRSIKVKRIVGLITVVLMCHNKKVKKRTPTPLFRVKCSVFHFVFLGIHSYILVFKNLI